MYHIRKSILIRLTMKILIPAPCIAAGCDNFFNDKAGEPYRIVFNSNRDGQYEIYIMNADGSEQTRLTNDPINDTIPKVSPDGSHIVFCKGNNIYTMDIDGSNQAYIITTNSSASPSWSPDGTRNVYAGTNQLRIVNVDGNGMREMLPAVEVTETLTQ